MISDRNVIVSGLYAFLNKPIVPSDTAQNRPSYPFIQYTITSENVRTEGNYIYTNETVDVRETLQQQPEIVISFTALSDTTEAITLAQSARSWFELFSNEYFQSNDITVVEVLQTENRTALQTDKYEYRYGFDVRFRIDRELTHVITSIDHYTIQEV